MKNVQLTPDTDLEHCDICGERFQAGVSGRATKNSAQCNDCISYERDRGA